MADSLAPTQACRPCRVLVADGDSNVRSALRLLLAREPGLEVVGDVPTVERLVPDTAYAQPDLILLDWDLPGLCATELLPSLRAACPTVAVVALSTRPERRVAACADGVAAFVCKTDAPVALLTAIRAVARCMA